MNTQKSFEREEEYNDAPFLARLGLAGELPLLNENSRPSPLPRRAEVPPPILRFLIDHAWARRIPHHRRRRRRPSRARHPPQLHHPATRASPHRHPVRIPAVALLARAASTTLMPASPTTRSAGAGVRRGRAPTASRGRVRRSLGGAAVAAVGTAWRRSRASPVGAQRPSVRRTCMHPEGAGANVVLGDNPAHGSPCCWYCLLLLLRSAKRALRRLCKGGRRGEGERRFAAGRTEFQDRQQSRLRLRQRGSLARRQIHQGGVCRPWQACRPIPTFLLSLFRSFLL